MSGSSIFFDKRLWSNQTFTSNGSFSVPDGVNLVFVEMFGGGGSGGCNGTGINAGTGAYGGEGGQYVVKPVTVTPGSSVTVTIGVGGAPSGTANSPVDGLPGTNTTFGAVRAAGGFGGSANVNTVTGVAGRGIGRGSAFANGGASFIATAGNPSFLGGDAGFGQGGDAKNASGPSSSPTNGGIGAGGGATDVGTSGAGGNGYCKVYWRAD